MLNRGKKKVGKAFKQVDSMVQNLEEGLADLNQAKEQNMERMKELDQEKSQINSEIHAAENFMANLEKLKG